MHKLGVSSKVVLSVFSAVITGFLFWQMNNLHKRNSYEFCRSFTVLAKKTDKLPPDTDPDKECKSLLK
jgi:hypothetical protein